MAIIQKLEPRKAWRQHKPLKRWQAVVLICLTYPMWRILFAMSGMLIAATLRQPVSAQGWAALGMAMIYGFAAIYYRSVERQCANELADRRLVI
ncbi:MAG: hypothetical protein ACREPQ_06080 [Rhodanobacter sp.]